MNSKSQPISQLSLNLAGCTNNGSTVAANISCNAANGIFGNSNGSGVTPQTYAISIPTQAGPDNAIVKLDYHLNDHNALNGEYFIGRGTILGAASSVQPYWRTGLHTKNQIARAVWVWTPTSVLVNEARAGYDTTHAPVFTVECALPGGPNYAALGYNSGLSGTGMRFSGSDDQRWFHRTGRNDSVHPFGEYLPGFRQRFVHTRQAPVQGRSGVPPHLF